MTFNSKEILETVQKKIAELNLPVPPKPATDDTEMQLPPDPSLLSSTALAQKLMRASSWFGYVQRLIGVLESELVLLNAEYKIKVNVLGIPVRNKLGKQNKEVIESIVLNENKDIMPLYTRIQELTSIRETLNSRMEIYHKFYAALSREQSRRESESRVG